MHIEKQIELAVRPSVQAAVGSMPAEYTIVVTREAAPEPQPERETTITLGDASVQAALVGGGAQCGIQSLNPVLGYPSVPSGYRLPYGAIGFTLAGCAGEVQFALNFPSLPAGAEYRKAIDGRWVTSAELGLSATISGNTLALTLSDGGPGDASPAGDGRIVDPGAIFVSAQAEPTPVPSLGHLALVLLAGLLAWFAPLRRTRGVQA